MRHDYLGNAVSGGDDATLAAIDDFVGGFLGYEERLLAILAGADGAPGHCLANAYAGYVWMFLESPEAPARAATYLERATRAAPSASARERAHVALLRSWSAGDVAAATAIAGEILAAAPRDLVALKLHQYFDFNRGLSPEMLRVALAALPAAGDVPQLHGMLAFAYEQCHLLADAEAAARRALALLPREPWAQHALAHVMLTQGRIDEGIGFLESASAGWRGLTSFMDTHNWWHLALFYLSEGRDADVLRLYDEHVFARDRTYSQDQVGAVSLLARLELAGATVGERWTVLGGYLAARRADVVEPFLSLQYLYGLARAGRPEAGELLAAIEARAGEAPTAVRAAWAEVALPAAHGLLAHAAGDAHAARRWLGPLLPRLLEIGGSHAQRDLFQQIYLDALLRSGGRIAAQQLLEERRRSEPRGVALNRALAGLYAGLGLPVQAAEAAARASRP
ncbi:MAG: tetratricopeptide repeat protein [Proteobacteria bacterium]|nr:tetratricopeptide repeat protein [Pseudomonadota bacterium]